MFSAMMPRQHLPSQRRAIAVLFEIARQINTYKKDDKVDKASSLARELIYLGDILGILQDRPEEYFTSGSGLTGEEIESYILKRNQARLDKDFELSDQIRDQLLDQGIILEDKESGTTWKRS